MLNMSNRFIKQKVFLFLMVLALQFFVAYSFYGEFFQTKFTMQKFIFMALVQLALILIFYAFLSVRFITVAVTLYLLLSVNLILTFIDSIHPAIGLRPNLDKYIQVHGDVIVGVNGIKHISTDSHGFRVTRKIDYESNSAIRIFAIGGSTTEQIHLDDMETWTAILEKLLQGKTSKEIQVINAGVSGPRAEQHYATFLQVVKFKPSIVLFMTGINDWNKDIVAQVDGLGDLPVNRLDIMRSVLYHGVNNLRYKVVGWGKNQPSELNVINGIEQHDGSYYANQNNSLERRQEVKRLSLHEVSKQYKYWTEKIVRECSAQKIICLFINQPSAYSENIEPELKSRLWMTPPNQSWTLPLEDLIKVSSLYNSWLVNQSKSRYSASCDIANNVLPSTKYLFDDCHFNEGGAKLVASLITPCVESLIQASER